MSTSTFALVKIVLLIGTPSFIEFGLLTFGHRVVTDLLRTFVSYNFLVKQRHDDPSGSDIENCNPQDLEDTRIYQTVLSSDRTYIQLAECHAHLFSLIVGFAFASSEFYSLSVIMYRFALSFSLQILGDLISMTIEEKMGCKYVKIRKPGENEIFALALSSMGGALALFAVAGREGSLFVDDCAGPCLF